MHRNHCRNGLVDTRWSTYCSYWSLSSERSYLLYYFHSVPKRYRCYPFLPPSFCYSMDVALPPLPPSGAPSLRVGRVGVGWKVGRP